MKINCKILPLEVNCYFLLHMGSSNTGSALEPLVVRLVFDNLYRKPTLILLDHAGRMLVCPQHTVTFLNEKAQRQLGSSDCGLFALAFATDLCHGLDPLTRSYNQKDIRQHYVNWSGIRENSTFPQHQQKSAVPHTTRQDRCTNLLPLLAPQ